MTPPQEAYRHYLEILTPEALNNLSQYVDKNIRFKDPFNDVTGINAMKKVFNHMFQNISDIRFTVHRSANDEHIALMDWLFEGTLRGKPWSFKGTSVITFSSDGLVTDHIDYWDAAQNFYEKLPVIGSLLALIRRRIATR